MNVDIYVNEQLTAFPGIYCAQCGETIKDASEANLIFKEVWGKGRQLIRQDIYTVHKECDDDFTARRPCADGERYSWISLDAALYMLLRNCRYKPSRAKRAAALSAQ